jgi:hypothetical protein
MPDGGEPEHLEWSQKLESRMAARRQMPVEARRRRGEAGRPGEQDVADACV